MARIVYCQPNGPEEIDGIKFTPHALGMISDDISDEAVVARLLTIPGFQAEEHDSAGGAQASTGTGGPAPSLVPAKPSKGDKDGDGVPDKEQRVALMARLKELNVKCNPAITLDNLKVKVAEAEEDAKNKAAQQEQQQQDSAGTPAAAEGSSEGAADPAAAGQGGAASGSTEEVF